MSSDLLVQGTGELRVYFAGQAAAYTSLVYEDTGGNNRFLFQSNPQPGYGTWASLGLIPDGTQLVFRIDVQDNEDTFYTGPASANPDNIVHALVTSFAGDAFIPAGQLVGFEDNYGGGDLDFNDLSFVVAAPVPEPSSFLLGGLGLMVVGRKVWQRRGRKVLSSAAQGENNPC